MYFSASVYQKIKMKMDYSYCEDQMLLQHRQYDHYIRLCAADSLKGYILDHGSLILQIKLWDSLRELPKMAFSRLHLRNQNSGMREDPAAN